MTPSERRWQRRWADERARRERAESSASEWQDRFRLFLDHAPMPAFIRDQQGWHVYGNKPWAAQFERPLSELIGKTNWPNCRRACARFSNSLPRAGVSRKSPPGWASAQKPPKCIEPSCCVACA